MFNDLPFLGIELAVEKTHKAERNMFSMCALSYKKESGTKKMSLSITLKCVFFAFIFFLT